MITESTLPMVLVPLTFLFVLLIILIAKAPKAGAGVVGGLILLAPFCLYRLAQGGALRQEEAIPLVVLPLTFLFVLLVILLAKAPKVGAGLVIALVVVGVLGGLWKLTSPRVSPSAGKIKLSQTWPEQQTESGAGSALVEQRVQTVQEFERVFSDYTRPEPPSAAAPLLDSGSIPPPPAPPAVLSPIWSEGIDQEFEADVYPSKTAAARALGLQMTRPIRKIADDPNALDRLTVFQEGLDRALAAEFVHSLEKGIPRLKCALEGDLRDIRPREVGVILRIDETRKVTDYSAPLGTGGSRVMYTSLKSASVEGGAVVATAFTETQRTGGQAQFVEKPWVEDFATFANARPNQHYIVARSNETCTSEGEANLQALNDARTWLAEALRTHPTWRSLGLPQPAVTIKDVLMDDVVVDRFAQSFSGSAGRIWRQALLIDASGSILARLADVKAREMRSERMSLVRMGFSALGVVVLIGVIYFFLNMATMGYYEWSLRIAGVILAIVAVISILMIVQ